MGMGGMNARIFLTKLPKKKQWKQLWVWENECAYISYDVTEKKECKQIWVWGNECTYILYEITEVKE